MAEPARNLYDEDKPENKNDPSPRFEVHKGGGETTTPKKGHLKSLDGDSQASKSEKDLYNEGDKKLSASKAEELEARQLGVKPENKDSLYNIKAEVPTNLIKKNKKTAAFMAVAATMVVGISIFFFVILAPLKILHIVNNLQDRFFATAENAVDKEMDRLLSNYIKGKIRYWNFGQNCNRNGWIDHACNPYSTGDGLIRKLYRGWSDGKLEDNLRKNYGIQFARRDSDSTLYMDFFHKDGTRDTIQLASSYNNWFEGGDTLDDLLKNNPEWTPVKRQEIRLALKKALEGETRYKRVMYRIKVGKLLERKYGVKRCIIGCKYRDNFADWRDDKKRALKMNAAQRVLMPRSITFGSLYQCVISTECGPEDFKNLTPDSYQATAGGCTGNCIDGGEPKSQFDRDNRSMLASRLVDLYDGDVEKLRSDYDNVRRYGLFASIGRFSSRVDDDGTSRAQGRLDGDLARTIAVRGGARAIPVIGQIDMAANIIEGVDTLRVAGPAMITIMNSTSASQYFSMFRTTADEMKEGQVDNEMFGSFVEGLGPGVQIDSTATEQLGGTAGAEQSPLYGILMGERDERASFALGRNLFFNNASAQTNSADYDCPDNRGSPTPENPICPQQVVRQTGNAVLEGFNRVTSNNFWRALVRAASIWNDGARSLLNIITGWFGYAFCGPLNYFLNCGDRLAEAADEILGPITGFLNDVLRDAIMFVFTEIFGLSKDIVVNQMSGAWAFNAMAAGADVAGNAYSHSGLGGRVLTSQEVAHIYEEQESEKYLAYQSQPLLKRIFDKESKYSPISKMALAAPSSKKELLSEGPVTYISSLFGSLFSSASNLFGKSAEAQRVMDDPFGIDQYGYPENDPTLEIDPETFWNQNCVTTSEGSTPNTWSLPRLYNEYSALTAQESNSYSPTNGVPNIGSLSAEVRDDPVRLAEATLIINALLQKSPQGTNRCLLIQAAVGSGGAIFTDDVLSPEEKGTSISITPTPNTQPGGNLPPPTGADQSSTQCDSRTRDIGIYQGYQNGSPIQIRLCALPNLPSTGQESNGGYNVSGGNGQALVNAAVSRNFYELVEAANAALPSNLRMSANSSFRTMAHQEELCRQDDKCPGGDYSDVARPGTSNHQMGLAIDFDIKGISESVSSCIREGSFCSARGFQDWEWLNSNATRFGLRQYSNEFWHFSPTGS